MCDPVCTYARSACAPSTAWLCTALAFCVLWLKAKLEELSTSKYRPSPIELCELTMTCWLEPGSLTVMNCSSLYFSNAGVNSDMRLGLDIVSALISASPRSQLCDSSHWCMDEIPAKTSASYDRSAPSDSQEEYNTRKAYLAGWCSFYEGS